jgi:glycosyltransferase involved in cell wall biosynthesis
LRIGDDRRIEVTPRFPADALPDVLANATVGALPSYIEGFGLGVLETLAAGRPCVTYDVPGPRSLAGAVRRDWLTPVAQPMLFGQRLAEIAAEERVRPGRFAEECVRFAESYNWRAVAEATLALYLRA